MTESEDYDQGYYEGMRNAIVLLIGLHMAGEEVNAIIKQLAAQRDDARKLWQEWHKDEDDAEW